MDLTRRVLLWTVTGVVVQSYLASPSWSQNPPFGAFAVNTSGTVGNTASFQLILNQNTQRRGCEFQNQGTATMYVYFGNTANTATAIKVTSGNQLLCGTNDIVMQDPIYLQGTNSTDAWQLTWE
jgi:hypothetical protein